MSEALSNTLRDLTQRAGLWPLLRRVRASLRGEVGAWIRAGCPDPAPNVVKIAIVRSYLARFGLRRFIETATFWGAMTDAIGRTGVRVDSIELDDRFFERAQRVFANRPNITIHHGDSAKVLPTLLEKLDEPALFWLDAHYSGPGTARSELDTPISAELGAILRHARPHVILIDDARHFLGADGYPRLGQLLESVAALGSYGVTVSCDIIRCVANGLVPKSGSVESPGAPHAA